MGRFKAMFVGARARSGATAIEYGLIIGLIAFGIFGLTENFGTSVAEFFGRITPVFDAADPT